MRLYLLRFSHIELLHRAFELLSDSEWVGSCLVEPHELRIRFLAPEMPGEELVERIYAGGGLRWCSRHALTSSTQVAESGA